MWRHLCVGIKKTSPVNAQTWVNHFVVGVWFFGVFFFPSRASDPLCKKNPAQASQPSTYPLVIGLIRWWPSWFTLAFVCQRTTTYSLTAWQQLAGWGPALWLGVDISQLLKRCNHLPLHMELVQSLDSNQWSSGFRVRIWHCCMLSLNAADVDTTKNKSIYKES